MPATATAIIAAFNLLCTGTTSEPGLFGISKTPSAAEYRVNLDTGQWCDGACAALSKIAEISPSRVILRDDPYDPSRNFFYRALLLIDRTNGEFTLIAARQVTKGTCVKKEFTGFPVPAVKF